ncbi:MAG: hypothetical protein JNL98_39390, partial [Bryobacterales bacterium]|nr:hypothetical protein [Bryobacterales bacterium]
MNGSHMQPMCDAAMHRRAFLGRGAAGLGLIALNSLLNPRLLANRARGV